MRIARARLRLVEPRATRALWTAHGPMTARPALLLALEDDDGRVGVGEASPLPGYSPDSLAAVRAALEAFRFDSLSFDLGGDLLAQLTVIVASLPSALPAARFAVESALLDVLGKRLGRPAWSLLSGREVANPVPLSALLTGERETDLLDGARRATDRGVRTLKWKIGRPGRCSEELAGLRALRRHVGAAIALRLDANRAFTAPAWAEHATRLAEFHPALVEEPAATPLAELEPSPFAIAADESLQGEHGWLNVERAIRAGRCQTLVLKPTVLGGALACLALARNARALGANAYVTHSFDGPVALASACALALALALEGPNEAAGLDRHPWLPSSADADLPMLGRAEVRPTEHPGLGISPETPR